MKRLGLALGFVFLFLCSSIVPLEAASTTLSDIAMDVTLKEDGTAHIKEVWDMSVNEGTEVYKIFNNMGESELENLQVRDENGLKYTFIGEWDTSASREQKRGKCGFVYGADSYELCFGVGDYGSRVYTFEYDVTNFVKEYKNNYYGFNYAFFSELFLEPQHVKIDITSPFQLNAQNSEIYGYGYYGNVVFSNGNIVMETSKTVPSNGKMQLVFKTDKVFTGAYPRGTDIDKIIEEAKGGSDWENKSKINVLGLLVGIMVPILCLIGFAVFIVHIIADSSQRKLNSVMEFSDGHGYSKDIPMFRDIPCNKNILEFYYLSKKAGIIDERDRGGLIAAILLRLVRDGHIEYVKENNKGLVFKREGYSIDLDKEIPVNNDVERTLIQYLKQASGKNLKLEPKEFERWCSSNYTKVDAWFLEVMSYVSEDMIQKGLIKRKLVEKKVLYYTTTQTQEIYDPKVRESIEQIMGLKKFLSEMSLIDEKEVIEVKMWEEYLMFASILGIADQVEKELGRLCPEFNEYSRMDTVYTMRMVHTMSNASVRAANSAASSGGGGSSSFGGGGGGFSGGGGGGVR